MNLPDDFYSKSLFDVKIRYINRKKYRGKGRPRTSDYFPPMSISEIQKMLSKQYEDFLNNEIKPKIRYIKD